MIGTADEQDLNCEQGLEIESEISEHNSAREQTDRYGSAHETGQHENLHQRRVYSAAGDAMDNSTGSWRNHTGGQTHAGTQAYYSTRPIPLANPFGDLDIISEVSSSDLFRRGGSDSLERVRDLPLSSQIYVQDGSTAQPIAPSSTTETITVSSNVGKYDAMGCSRSNATNGEHTSVNYAGNGCVLRNGFRFAGPGPSMLAQEKKQAKRSESRHSVEEPTLTLDSTLLNLSDSQKSFSSVPHRIYMSKNCELHRSYSSSGQSSPTSLYESSQNTRLKTVFNNTHSNSLQQNEIENMDADASRGRSIRRTLRNTFSAAEHYASSLFFGRGASANSDGFSSPR